MKALIHFSLKILAALFFVAFFCGDTVSQNDVPKVVREIFVPESEIAKIMDGCTDRIFLGREEFE